jgi:hypothetical protein
MNRDKLLAALRGRSPESAPIELAEGVAVVLRVVPAARKELLRVESRQHVLKTHGEGLGAEEYDTLVDGEFVLRVLAAANTADITLEEIREHLASPVLRKLWAEYNRLESVIEARTDEELDQLYKEVQAIVGEDRRAAEQHFSTCAWNTLLTYAISTVRPPTS